MQSDLIVDAVLLAAVLEADLGGHRKIGKFRLLRPLALAAVIIPLYLTAVTTSGAGGALEVAGAAAGIVLGFAATSLMTVYRSPGTSRPVKPGRARLRRLVDHRHRRPSCVLLRLDPLVQLTARPLDDGQPRHRRRHHRLARLHGGRHAPHRHHRHGHPGPAPHPRQHQHPSPDSGRRDMTTSRTPRLRHRPGYPEEISCAGPGRL